MQDDIIVAIATPRGKNGIGVVRISGKNCLDLARKMFCALNSKSKIESNKMVLGNILLQDGVQDKGYMVFFQNPYSYTGEDVVEFQCHGGMAVTEKVLEKVILLGARLAEPGEFSKRAFLNGKMTLDQAEGVIDVINAENARELKASSDLAKGELTKQIDNMQDNLADLLSEIEVNMDYPEHDIEYKTKEHIKNEVKELQEKINALINTETIGKAIRSGVNVAIIGKPNVGKSSLLNAILNYEQAIVTDVAGTTRDVVLGVYEYKGIKFNFLDTAGLHDTNDKVESIGVEKSKQTINSADIILFVKDISSPLDDEDKKIEKLIKGKNTIFVANKSDLKENVSVEENTILVSAKQKTNIESLKEKIWEISVANCDSDGFIVTNIRHMEILKTSSGLIDEVLRNIDGVTLDCVALDLHEIWNKLGEITGETNNEEIIDKIFSKFCLGK